MQKNRWYDVTCCSILLRNLCDRLLVCPPPHLSGIPPTWYRTLTVLQSRINSCRSFVYLYILLADLDLFAKITDSWRSKMYNWSQMGKLVKKAPDSLFVTEVYLLWFLRSPRRASLSLLLSHKNSCIDCIRPLSWRNLSSFLFIGIWYWI